jgi:hypothetical protein
MLQQPHCFHKNAILTLSPSTFFQHIFGPDIENLKDDSIGRGVLPAGLADQPVLIVIKKYACLQKIWFESKVQIINRFAWTNVEHGIKYKSCNAHFRVLIFIYFIEAGQ